MNNQWSLFEGDCEHSVMRVQVAKPNVLTIGAAFYYTLKHIKSE